VWRVDRKRLKLSPQALRLSPAVDLAADRSSNAAAAAFGLSVAMGGRA
jgi:hypothetical protein